MSEHRANVSWAREGKPFTYEGYPRIHRWQFGGGVELNGSSAPEYLGDASLPNPEEALVMALSSCHMLTFLAIAARKRLTVDSYEDQAVGHMEKNAEGRIAITGLDAGQLVALDTQHRLLEGSAVEIENLAALDAKKPAGDVKTRAGDGQAAAAEAE